MSEKKAADATTLAVIRDWIKGLFYQKPSSGIPKTDLASGVQSSLDKADSALQSHQSLADYVKGPSSSGDARVAVFNGTGGKTIKDSGFTIGKSVPSDAKFTDTTYSSKAAVSGGTEVSLVTTGEKYIWNNKGGGVNYSDTAIGTAVPLNADTLNGYASSEFVMASDAISISTIDNLFV